MKVATIISAMALTASLLSGLVFGAERPPSASATDKLQDQVRELDKDLSILKEISAARLEAQDKRLADMALATAQHANHLASIANQTTTVGNYIAFTSIGITLIVFLAGFITYFSAKSRAEKEARDAAEKWFKEQAASLNEEIEKLRRKASAASTEIATHTDSVATEAKAASKKISVYADAILGSAKPADGIAERAPDKEAVKAVKEASGILKDKPESRFTADDYYTRGLDRYAQGNYQSALSVFKLALEKLPANAASESVARFLFAQGVTLGTLGKSEEEIAVYEQIDQRYGKDESPAVRAQVATARNGKAFNRILLAKQNWVSESLRMQQLSQAIDDLQRALEHCAATDKAMVLGNLGYAYFLSSKPDAAIAPTRECLKLGGQQTLDTQRADAAKHRVEPWDTDYVVLLQKIWDELAQAGC